MKPEDVDWYAGLQWDSSTTGAIADELASYPFNVAGQRVLDLAAGPGAFTAVVARAGANEVVWLDADATFLDIARERCVEPGVVFVLGDMDALPFAPAAFDVVFLRTAIYWSKDERALACALARLVRPGGWLVVRSPWWRRPLRTIRPLPRALAHLASPWLGLALGRKPLTTLWTFRSATRRRLRRAGFRIESETREPLAFTLVALRES